MRNTTNVLWIIVLLSVLSLFGCGFLDEDSPMDRLTGTWGIISAKSKEDGVSLELEPPAVEGEIKLNKGGNGFTTSITIGFLGITTKTTGELWEATETTLTLYATEATPELLITAKTEVYDYEIDSDTLTLINKEDDGVGELKLQKK